MVDHPQLPQTSLHVFGATSNIPWKSSSIFPDFFIYPMISPWFPYDFPMSSRFPHDFPMISPWFPHDFPKISPWFPYDFLISPWFPLDFPMSSLFPYDSPMISRFHEPVLSQVETFLAGPLLVELHLFGLRLQLRLPAEASFAELYHSCEVGWTGMMGWWDDDWWEDGLNRTNWDDLGMMGWWIGKFQ